MPVTLRNADGQVMTVDDQDANYHINRGWFVETPDVRLQAADAAAAVPEDRGALAALGATASSALSGLTFGGSDVLLGALATEGRRREMREDRAARPVLTGAANLAGSLLPALVAPTSLLARTPAGIVGQAAARGYEAGRALGGVRGAAQAAAATGVEGALQSGGAYLSDIALGDRDLTAEGMAGALGTGFAFGGAAGGALYGITSGTIAARRMFARQADSPHAAELAEQEWKQQSQTVLEANDQAADLARQRLAEMRAAREQAELAVQRADAGIADIKAGRGSKPSAEEVKLSEALTEHDAARLEFEAMLKKLEAPSIEPGIIPQPPGVPVGEFGAPGARGYDPAPLRSPSPPEPVPAQTGDVTAVGKKKFAQGTPAETPKLGEIAPKAVDDVAAEAPIDKPKLRIVEIDHGDDIEEVLEGLTTANPKYKRVGTDEYSALKKDFKSKLTPSERDAIVEYSGESSYRWNERLRSGRIGEDDREVFEQIDVVIDKGRASRPVQVYRGLEGDNVVKMWDGMQPGDRFTDRAWASTSAEIGMAKRGEVTLAIDVPAGYPAAAIPTKNSLENELLLRRDTIFEVVSIGKLDDGHTIAHVQVVPTPAPRPLKFLSREELKSFKPSGDSFEIQRAAQARSAGSADSLGQDKFFADLIRPKTRDAYVAQNIGRAMREEGSHAGALAKVEREWAEMSGGPPASAPPVAASGLEQQLLEMQQRLGAGATIGELGAAKRAQPVSLKQLEQQYDEIVQRADEAADVGTKQQLLRQASQIEEQIAAASPRSLVHDVADIAPVATRYEQAAAAVTEAVDDVAPQVAKDVAKALRDAEALADTKLMDRAARAVDDAADPPKPAKTKKSPELDQARARKLNAEADLASARVAESEARLGAQSADRIAKDARASAERATDVIGLPKPPINEHGRRLGALGDVGAALEVADVIGIPGLPRPRDIPIIGGLLSAYLKFRAIKAAAGRFTGRVEATGNAKAAVLAAKTKDRIASAVDQSLGLVGKHASKARAPTVAVGVRVMNALRDRAIDDGEPDAPRDATLTQVAAVRMREVGAAAANPQLIIAKVRHEMRDVHDPDLIAAMEKHQVAKYQHLNDVAPKAPPPNPYTKRQWEPSPAVALSWGRRYEVANDPAVAFEALRQQSLTPQMAETLRAVYPKLFAMAQERLVSRAGDLDKPVDYKQCLRNSLLFDVPLHPSLEPESLAVLQGAHTPIPLTPEPQPGPPAPSIAGGGALTNLYTTGADRRASMR